MEDRKVAGALTDIGTEELGHLEIVATIIHHENMAAEQKARLTYDNILRIIKDPEIADPIRFLRMREIVHFQRFGECLRRIQDQRNPKNFYAYNQQIDKKKC